MAMNSKQRRLIRRYYKHEVVLNDVVTYKQYAEMFVWCSKIFGNKQRDGWRIKPREYSVWQFDCPKKAIEFTLRWL